MTTPTEGLRLSRECDDSFTITYRVSDNQILVNAKTEQEVLLLFAQQIINESEKSQDIKEFK